MAVQLMEKTMRRSKVVILIELGLWLALDSRGGGCQSVCEIVLPDFECWLRRSSFYNRSLSFIYLHVYVYRIFHY